MQPLYIHDFLAKNKPTWKKSLQELLKSVCNLDYFEMNIQFKWHMINLIPENFVVFKLFLLRKKYLVDI